MVIRLLDKDLKYSVLSIFKELKETINKELRILGKQYITRT